MVDFDRVCGTNTNRQLHAMKGTYGKFKADLIAERCSLISPETHVIGRRAFYHADTADILLPEGSTLSWTRSTTSRRRFTCSRRA
ncbi:MAG: hypothetical protein R3E66_20120 [bacterium]